METVSGSELLKYTGMQQPMRTSRPVSMEVEDLSTRRMMRDFQNFYYPPTPSSDGLSTKLRYGQEIMYNSNTLCLSPPE